MVVVGGGGGEEVYNTEFMARGSPPLLKLVNSSYVLTSQVV